MITIATYDNSTDAHIAKGLLKANGIPAIITNEGVTAILPLLGGVELQVAPEDAEKARKILASVEKG